MPSDVAFPAARTRHSSGPPDPDVAEGQPEKGKTPAPDVGVTLPVSAWRATRKKLDSFAVHVPFSCCVLICGKRARGQATKTLDTPWRRTWTLEKPSRTWMDGYQLCRVTCCGSSVNEMIVVDVAASLVLVVAAAVRL